MSSTDRYGPLWRLLAIPDEAIVHSMEQALRRAGVYSLEDLAFLSFGDIKFPAIIKPVFVRKFKSVCDFYALGHTLDADSTMQDVLIALNPRASRPAPPVPPPAPPPLPKHQVPVVKAVAPPEPAPQTRQLQHLNVVIIGNCAPRQPGWEHLEQFSKISSVRIHSIINSGPTDESLLVRCNRYNIHLESRVDDLSVPQPNLYVLCSTRNHDLFKLMDMYHAPSCVLLDLPGTVTSKSLQALQACTNDTGCPIYLNLSRVVAPYIQQTLDVASHSVGDPKVSWYNKEDFTMATMADAFAKGRLLHTTALNELVIAVMYFGCKVEAISRMQVNPGMTEQLTIGGIKDYVRAAFQMTTHSGVHVSIIADRGAPAACCLGVVSDDQGRVIQQFDHFHGNCELMLKRRLVRSLMEESPEILPSIRIGVEALRLAEYAEKHLNKNHADLTKPKRNGLMRMLSRKSS